MDDTIKIENIKIDKIIPNIYQPRIKFDENKINELANSIEKFGIIQPLILRKNGEKYEIIDGERRYKAAKKLKLETIPARVLDVNEKTAAEILLEDNMQKQLLSPLEEANSYQQILLLNKLTTKELAEKFNLEKTQIENKLNLLKLPPEIQDSLLNNKISEGHAKLLIKVKERKKQIELYNDVIEKRLTVKELEDLINKKNNKSDLINLPEEKEKNKTEENMDNTQLNFNQYNNLLKEKEKPEMVNNSQPEPIIGNNFVEPKANEFFPSLEEQPLNFEVPFSNEKIQEPMQMPTFEVPNMQPMEPQMAPVATPAFEPVQQATMPEPTQMPTFEVPNMQPMEPQMNQIATPAFEPVQAQPMQEFDALGNSVTSQIPNIMIDVMPAVNMIRNLMPLLENSGYKIILEEQDNSNEYQVVIKLQK